MTQHLISYAAFWHSDKPWGFGATIMRDESSGEFFDTFFETAEKLGENLHTDSDMTVEEANAQLRQFVASYKGIRSKDLTDQKLSLLILMFGNVKFLTLKKALPQNDFNGLQYAYLY